MKCGNCDNFVFGKCKDDKCYGGCEIDSKNRTVHMEQECIVNVEDLKCYKFDGGEIEYVMARSKDEAIQYYNNLTGFEFDEYEVEEIKEWHKQIVNVETPIMGWREATFLEVAKEDYTPWDFEPYVISTTCY